MPEAHVAWHPDWMPRALSRGFDDVLVWRGSVRNVLNGVLVRRWVTLYPQDGGMAPELFLWEGVNRTSDTFKDSVALPTQEDLQRALRWMVEA